MADHTTDKAAAQRRKADLAARMVLAKHPCVVGGGIPAARQADEIVPVSSDVGAHSVARGLIR